MPEPLWWAFRLLEVATLSACVLLAAGAWRRIGANTPYGTFLFVMAVGFWFLLFGNLMFHTRKLITGEAPPGTLADVLSLGGWVLLNTAFFLFLRRFEWSAHPPAHAALRVFAKAIVPVAFVVGLFFILAPRGVLLSDTQYAVRFVYIVVDGVGLGYVAASAHRLIKFHSLALGRLYLLLAAALVLKTTGDLAWVFLAGHPGLPGRSVASAFYPASGILAALALGLHFAHVYAHTSRDQRSDTSDMGDPTLRREQRALRDLTRHAEGIAGPDGGRIVNRCAVDAFAARNVAAKEHAGVIVADASAAVWADVLADVREGALRAFGGPATSTMAGVLDTYGARRRSSDAEPEAGHG